MQYVVRTDRLSNMMPGERTDLWLLTWDAASAQFLGSGDVLEGPPAAVRSRPRPSAPVLDRLAAR